MIARWFRDLFIDPRKLLAAALAAALAVMALGVMDYAFAPLHYLVILVLLAGQLALLACLPPVAVRLRVQAPGRVGWALLGLAAALVAYNVYLNGPPYLLLKVLRRLPLDFPMGDYYHQKCQLTFVLWPLLTVMLPAALLVRGRWVRLALVGFSLGASTLIQIKAPIVFGCILLAVVVQLTARPVRARTVAIVLGVLLGLFLFLAATRTRERLEVVAGKVGLAPAWRRLPAVLWFPLSYVGGPTANGFHVMSDDLLNWRLEPLVLTLPAAVLPEPARVSFVAVRRSRPLPWPEANTGISSVGTLSHMFGLAGMVAVTVLASWGLHRAWLRGFWGNRLLLAVWVVGVKNLALFGVGNYFIDASFAGEVLLVWGVLHHSRIEYAPGPAAEGQVPAVT